jgi:transcriptional regulator with XRE-family HTH domain
MFQFDRHIVEAERRKAGLRIEDLAAKTGLSYTAIYSIERGDRSPAVKSLICIADALGMAPGEFFVRRERSAA